MRKLNKYLFKKKTFYIYLKFFEVYKINIDLIKYWETFFDNHLRNIASYIYINSIKILLHLEAEKIKFEMQKNLKTRVNIPRVEI